jgi:Flp pilus assembly pilin Flp
MWRLFRILKRNRKGQNLIEYAIVAGIIGSSVIAMSTYVFRSVQATQQEIQKEFSED